MVNAQEPTGSVPVDPIVIRAAAVCGNCGNRYDAHHIEHFHSETHTFCNMHTNSDVFTDNPSVHAVYDFLTNREPDFMAFVVRQWKKANGHG